MSKENYIDITPLLKYGNESQSKRKMKNLMFGLHRETDKGITLQFPDGESELEWSVEQIEHFMETYLSNERGDSRWQNKRRWDYSVWRYIMDLYADGLRHEDIADRVRDEFQCYKVDGVSCTKYTIKSIIAYRNWKVAQRMKFLLSMEKAKRLLSRRRNAAIQAEELELGVIEDLRIELKGCIAVLKGLCPTEAEYGKTVSAIQKLKSMISEMSGLDSIRKIELFKEKQHVRIDLKPVEKNEDPRTITPTIISE